MRQFIIMLLVCLYSSTGLGQTKEQLLKDIKNQIEIINSYTEFDILSLEPEEFLTAMVDHGPSFNGYYEHNRLKKMVKVIGTPNADIVTDFYFWNDQLIFTSYKQRPYMKSAAGGQALDYSSAYTKYEEQHFYNDGKEIDKKTIGNALPDLPKQSNYLSYTKKMKKLLDTKFINKYAYDSIEFKWFFIQNRAKIVEFYCVLKINYRIYKYLDRYKMKIDGDVITCWTTSANKHQFKIEEITDTTLTLVQIPSNELLFYDRVE